MFLKVIGHEQIQTQLLTITNPVLLSHGCNPQEGRAGPALQRGCQNWLLTGPAHIGKRTLALACAQAINCVQDSVCGECSSCKQFPNHPDLLIVSPREVTKTGRLAREPMIPIAAISATHDIDKEFEFHVIDWLETGPKYKKKFVIIDQADKLNESAANSLLKILEEPPKYAIFILITENSEQILPTIASRVMKFELFPVSNLEKVFPKLDKELIDFASGRPGLLFDKSKTEKTIKTADKFLASLDNLKTALDEAKKISEYSDIKLLIQAINFRLRQKSNDVRTIVDQSLQKLDKSISKYATSQLVFSILAMEMRKSLKSEEISDGK